MSGFRERLLGFLHAHAAGRAEDLVGCEETPPASSRPAAGDDLAERFRRELEAVGGEVYDLAQDKDPESVVTAFLEQFRGGSVAIDGDPAWKRAGFSMRSLARKAGVEVFGVDGATEPTSLADVELGMTVADLAIAETGTIAQCVRPFRPRSLSLLPPAHLVALPRRRILAGLEDFFATIRTGAAGEGGDYGAYFTWITGPSRTADIEKVLTVGVHGPGRLVVFLLGEEEAL